MSQTWQTVLSVGGGVLAAWLAIRFASRKPRWAFLIDVTMAGAAAFVAVMIGLGHFDRLDAVWPAYAAVNFLAYGFGHTRAPKKPAVSANVADSRPASSV